MSNNKRIATYIVKLPLGIEDNVPSAYCEHINTSDNDELRSAYYKWKTDTAFQEAVEAVQMVDPVLAQASAYTKSLLQKHRAHGK